jgi:hypothetical protein
MKPTVDALRSAVASLARITIELQQVAGLASDRRALYETSLVDSGGDVTAHCLDEFFGLTDRHCHPTSLFESAWSLSANPREKQTVVALNYPHGLTHPYVTVMFLPMRASCLADYPLQLRLWSRWQSSVSGHRDGSTSTDGLYRPSVSGQSSCCAPSTTICANGAIKPPS